MNIKKTANLLLNFAIKRLAEIFGISIFVTGTMLLLALVSYSSDDPNFIFPDNTQIKNLLGFQGSFISDLFFQSIGLIAYLIPLTLITTGINVFRTKDFFLVVENIFFVVLYSMIGSLFFSHFYSEGFTLYINGNGGFIGSYLNQTFLNSFIIINQSVSYYIFILLIFLMFLIIVNFNLNSFFIILKKVYKFFF